MPIQSSPPLLIMMAKKDKGEKRVPSNDKKEKNKLLKTSNWTQGN